MFSKPFFTSKSLKLFLSPYRRKNVDSKSYIPLGENGNKSEAKKGSRIDAPNSDDEEQGTINMKIKVEKRINDDIDAGREDDDEGVKRYT